MIIENSLEREKALEWYMTFPENGSSLELGLTDQENYKNCIEKDFIFIISLWFFPENRI